MSENLNIGEQNTLLSFHEATNEAIESVIDETGTSFTIVLLPSTSTTHFTDNNVDPKVITKMKRKKKSVVADNDTHTFLEHEERKNVLLQKAQETENKKK